jgi:RES domain-containing protein
VYRSVCPGVPHLTRRLINGVRARDLTCRWTPLSNVRLTWGFPERATAVEEARIRLLRLGVFENAQPRTIIALEVDLETVWDLCDKESQGKVGLTEQDVCDPCPTERTHEVCEWAWEQGAEGLLVPSAVCRNGSILVVFPKNLGPDSRLALAAGMGIARD